MGQELLISPDAGQCLDLPSGYDHCVKRNGDVQFAIRVQDDLETHCEEFQAGLRYVLEDPEVFFTQIRIMILGTEGGYKLMKQTDTAGLEHELTVAKGEQIEKTTITGLGEYRKCLT